ncbi:hypothetical protein MWU60_08360 [Yoonia sp. F2084L]|uniref:hypothetical protein n=1 Tax=Yoonia sp. F2084L TaxID=2926419 RepID=UPI001FF400FC|nr:hypothetical protein [Yoonia sp. F2084L]MCK0095582.1 hypothetical protein [Yoonia sp. F2084L]
MNDPAQGPQERHQSVANVLMNASAAVRVTNEIVRDLELHLLQPVDATQGNPVSLKDLQSMDMLSQSLQEIETLLTRLAKAMPNSVFISQTDVIDPIRLEYLRRMIGDETGAPYDAEEPVNATDISLF